MIEEKIKKKILVADDSPTILEVLKTNLEKNGFVVVSASNGVEAIEKVYTESPDLLLLDIMMPKIKGYQVCRFLKANKDTQRIPVIMLSVKTEKEDVLWGKDSGADDYFSKDTLNGGTFLKLLNRIEELTRQQREKASSLVPPATTELLFAVSDLFDQELRKSKFLSQRLSSLFELSRELFYLSGTDKLCKQIMDSCIKLMDADSGSLMLLSGRENKLRIVSSFGINEEIAKDTEIDMGEGISGWVVQHREPLLLINGLEKHPLFSHLKTRSEVGSSICVPLLVNGKLTGVLNLNRLQHKTNFNSEDLEFVLTLANYLASVIEKERLYNELIQSEKMGALGYFASGMAHEIRNPLAAISAEAEYLLQRGEIKTLNKAPNIESSLESIVEQSNRISEIIERLLKFSHPKDEKKEPVDLAMAVEETLKLVSYQMKLDNIRIIKDFPDYPLKVKANLTQIEEVFLNLILNAHQAMPDGGNLEIRAEAKDDFVNIKFIDTGQGISREDLKFVFEPFFTTKEKGMGLGLFVSEQIIRSLGGWIEVESKLGKGTSFIVYLPVTKDA